MKPVADHTRRIVFIHIPKNAGTSVIEALNIRHGHKPMSFLSSRVKNWDQYKKICILRDPVDRFISCYNFAKMKTSHWHDIDGCKPIHPDREICNNHDINQIVDLAFEHADTCGIHNLSTSAQRVLKHLGWKTQSCWLNGDLEQVEFLSMNNFVEYFEGIGIKIPMLNKTRNIEPAGSMHDSSITKLKKLYECDYELIRKKL